MTNDPTEFSIRQIALARMKLNESTTSDKKKHQSVNRNSERGQITYDLIRKAAEKSRSIAHQANFTSINFQQKVKLSKDTESRLE